MQVHDRHVASPLDSVAQPGQRWANDHKWSSNLELWPANQQPVVQGVEVDDTLEGLLNSSDVHVDHLVDLEAGEEIEVWARSPQGDVAVVVIPPGGIVDQVGFFDPARAGFTQFDDSNEGLYGLDVR